MTKRSTTYGNPTIPAAQPHLFINNKLICQNLMKVLKHAMVFLAYKTFLWQKLAWTKQDIKNVHWAVFSATLSSLTQEDQHHIILFTNGKLLLYTSPAHPHHGSTLCPSCQCEPEDKWHFLQCTHWEQTAMFQTLHQQLTKLMQQLRLHPSILTTLWLGLVAIFTDTPYPDVMEEVLQTLKLPIQLQAKLGWENIYKGCLSSAWATAIDQEHPKLKQTGEQVLIMIKKHIWQFILDTRKLWNMLLIAI